MDLQLKGKRALVTGSTKGIGRAIAAELLMEGVEVVVHGQSAATVDPAVESLRSSGSVHGVAGDFSTASGVDEVIAGAEAIGPIDILISNAATYWASSFFDLTDDDWYRLIEANLLASVRLTRAFLGPMLNADWGRIVLVSSNYGVEPNPYLLHYSVTKAAAMTLMRGLAELTGGTRVTVNSVISGPTWTEGAAGFLGDVDESDIEEAKKAFFLPGGLLETSLLQRYAAPEEVAGLVTYLCSPRASCINGSAQRAEAGMIKTTM